jgi:hypothetical protein
MWTSFRRNSREQARRSNGRPTPGTTGATAFQAARVHDLLATGRPVAPVLGRETKAMLARPDIRHRFVEGLAGFPGVRITRKSGSWRRWHVDSALIEQAGTRYILLALAEHPDGGQVPGRPRRLCTGCPVVRALGENRRNWLERPFLAA